MQVYRYCLILLLSFYLNPQILHSKVIKLHNQTHLGKANVHMYLGTLHDHGNRDLNLQILQKSVLNLRHTNAMTIYEKWRKYPKNRRKRYKDRKKKWREDVKKRWSEDKKLLSLYRKKSLRLMHVGTIVKYYNNFEPRHEKTCPRGFATMWDSIRPQSEIRLRLESLDLASFNIIILYRQRITKTLIRLRGWKGRLKCVFVVRRWHKTGFLLTRYM